MAAKLQTHQMHNMLNEKEKEHLPGKKPALGWYRKQKMAANSTAIVYSRMP